MFERKIDNTRIQISICQQLWKLNVVSDKKLSIRTRKILNWMLKWILRLEDYVFPFSFTSFIWLRSKTYNKISHSNNFHYSFDTPR